MAGVVWCACVCSKGMKGLLGSVITQPQCGHGVFHAQIVSNRQLCIEGECVDGDMSRSEDVWMVQVLGRW